ncbi:hypothetical protein PGB90_001350 [Kerria lacca]
MSNPFGAVFSNGMKKKLAKLVGTIPVPFKGKVYHIPISITIMNTHPVHAPVCFVNPTPDMFLKPSKNLDHQGKIYLPYLHNWNMSSSNLYDLIKVMIETFSVCPPVFTKSKQEGLLSQSSLYPTQDYSNVTSTSTSPTMYPPVPSGTSVYHTPHSSYSTSQSGASNFQYPGYPPYPIPATSQPVNYPQFPASTPVSSPYPTQPSYPPYPSSQPNLVSSVSSTGNTGTITDEHIRASLMSAIEDKIRRKINEQTALCHDEIEILSQTQRELNQGKNKLDNMFDNMEKEKQNIIQKIQILKDKEIELEKTIEKLSVEEDVDVDDAVVTTTPLYKQILNTHCEDAAIEDTIYYIGEALRRGIIDLDIFIKQLRSLSRKRLLLRSLLEKCRIKAGLTI